MRIPNYPPSATTHDVSPAKVRREGGAPEASGGAAAQRHEPTVKVQVSDAARKLAESRSTDEAKVARLRSAVEDGSLRVDARAIADKIVESGG